MRVKSTVRSSVRRPSRRTSTVNVNVSPGAPDPGPLTTLMENAGVGGVCESSTVAVALTDTPLLVAVIVYEPEALFPSVSVVCACPLESVVVLVVFSVAFSSLGGILKSTVRSSVRRPSRRTSTVNVNVSPGSPDPGLVTTLMENAGVGGVCESSTVAVALTDTPLLVAVIVYEPEALFPSVSVVCACPLESVVVLVVFSVAFPSPEVE